MMSQILLRASIEGAAFAAILWVVIRIASGLSPAVRTMLWWCVAAKFVVALVWTTPISIPILPAERLAIPDASDVARGRSESNATDGAPAHGASSVLSGAKDRLPVVLVMLWVAGLLTAAVLAASRWKRMRDVMARSGAPSPATEALVADLVARMQIRRSPSLRISEEIATPLVTGVFQQVVLLPAGSFDALSEREQRMVLCHELAHIKRADLWLGCVPALAERLFFFHPLAHLAVREYAVSREAAADAHVITVLNEAPRAYGRLLLRLGVSDPRPSLGAAAASWSFSNLKRRIAMLDRPSSRSKTSRVLAGLVVAAAALAIVPLRVAARQDVAASGSVSSPHAAAATSASGTRTAALATPSDIVRHDRQAEEKSRLNFVFLFDDKHTTMSGSVRDIDLARRHRRAGERLLWFRHEGREYVIRDPGVLDEVVALWAPVNELGNEQGQLGAQQGELGAKQGELGAQQGALGAQQGHLGARQGELGTRQGVMAAREGALRTDAERRAFDEERRQIDREMRELDDQMRALDVTMRELDKRMRDLGVQMTALDKEMEILGRKMEEQTRKAEERMRTVLARALATGLAQVID